MGSENFFMGGLGPNFYDPYRAWAGSGLVFLKPGQACICLSSEHPCMKGPPKKKKKGWSTELKSTGTSVK